MNALLHISWPSLGPTRLLRWILIQLLPAWLCLGLSWVSTAAAAEEEAPMCDPHGASVAAPTEVPEIDRGKLEELPCDALLLWVGTGIDLGDSESPAVARGRVPVAPELHLDRERPDGVFVLALSLPERAAPDGLQEPRWLGLPPRQGHRSPVYRPPLFR